VSRQRTYDIWMGPPPMWVAVQSTPEWKAWAIDGLDYKYHSGVYKRQTPPPKGVEGPAPYGVGGSGREALAITKGG